MRNATALVEPGIRRVVCETLGVEERDLVPGTSLVDDLAADSLDLLELAAALESALGVTLPSDALRGVRTYGDLVATVAACRAEERSAEAVAPWLRIVTATARGAGVLRIVPLSRYVVDTVGDEAARSGRGARVDVTVPAAASDATLARVEDEFARLARRGVDVRVTRERRLRDVRSDSYSPAA